MRRRGRRPSALSAAPGRTRTDRPGTPDGRAPHQGGTVPDGEKPRQFRLHGDPFAQQDIGPGARPLRVHRSPRERDRGRQQRHRQESHRSRIGAGRLPKGLSVGFTTAAAMVHELIEARDEKRLLRLQRQLAAYTLLIIDELGYVPLSTTGAELLFEVFSQRYERGSTLVTSNLPFDEWTGVFGSERLTGALLDRLTHHVHILEMNGDSYRLKQSKQRQRRT